MTTAIEVAEMEAAIKMLREEHLRLTVELAKTNKECELLRMEILVANEAARVELIRSTTMRTIINQVSAGLIDGIRVMERSSAEDTARARLRAQEPNISIIDTSRPIRVRDDAATEAINRAIQSEPEDRRPQFLKDREPNPDAPVMMQPRKHPHDLDERLPANTYSGLEVDVESEMAALANTIKHNG